MANKIKLKRGLKSTLPTLETGEPGFTTDTHELFIGTSSGNAKVGGSSVTRAATYIVAASNSKHKNEADYVCDGTADEVEINAALSALPSNGGKVLLMEGTYNCSNEIEMWDCVTLEGMGRDNTSISGTVCIFGIRVEVCNLHAEHIEITGSDVSIHDCAFGSDSDHTPGLKIAGYGGCCYVYNNKSVVDDIDRIAVDIECNSNQNYIYNNILNTMTATGIKITGSYNVISGNSGNMTEPLVTITSGNKNVVVNNYGAGNDLIDIVDDSGTDTVISGNVQIYP